MAQSPWTDERIDQILGNLLRSGVLIASSVVLVGAILYLTRHGTEVHNYQVFRGEPPDLRGLRGILQDVVALSSRGIIQLGIVLLLATPVARVLFSVFAFARQRDYTYVVVTLLVLAILLYSMLRG
jgi:uncharacterized membrane protein